MCLNNIQLSIILVLITFLLCGCPMATTPTKEQAAESGSSSQPKTTPTSGSTQSSTADTGQAIPSSSPQTTATGESAKPQRSTNRNTSSTQKSNKPSSATEDEQLIEAEKKDPESTPTVATANADSSNTNATTNTPSQQDPDLLDEELNSGSQSSQQPNVEDSQSPTESMISAQDIIAYNQRNAATSTEKIRILDSELDDSGARFDQMILRERENIRNQAKQKGGISGTAKTEDFEIKGQTSSDNEVDNAVANAGKAGGQSGTESSATRRPIQVATYAPPANIPDGSDDDVVARQLREAASREADPTLRGKLWEEYRKYKGANK